MPKTFFKLHHGFLTHPKHAELSNDALLLHIAGCSFASENLTDGRLDKSPMIRTQWALRFVAQGVDVDALTDELLAAEVWADRGEWFEIVNYTKHNNTRAEVDEIRENARQRKAKQRAKDSSSSSTENKYKSPPTRHGEVTRDVTGPVTRDRADVIELPNADAVDQALADARKAVGR